MPGADRDMPGLRTSSYNSGKKGDGAEGGRIQREIRPTSRRRCRLVVTRGQVVSQKAVGVGRVEPKKEKTLRNGRQGEFGWSQTKVREKLVDYRKEPLP